MSQQKIIDKKEMEKMKIKERLLVEKEIEKGKALDLIEKWGRGMQHYATEKLATPHCPQRIHQKNRKLKNGIWFVFLIRNCLHLLNNNHMIMKGCWLK